MRPIGSFTIGADHPALPGHFPGRPIVPGVVLLDEAAALILAAEPGFALAGISAARFIHPVRPGDQVDVVYADGALRCSVAQGPVLSATIALRAAS